MQNEECKYWYNENGLLHREDGPAIEYADGEKEYWINGERHRFDGPAIESYSGNEWWYKGQQVDVNNLKDF